MRLTGLLDVEVVLTDLACQLLRPAFSEGIACLDVVGGVL
jgi:hypothetical protein